MVSCDALLGMGERIADIPAGTFITRYEISPENPPASAGFTVYCAIEVASAIVAVVGSALIEKSPAFAGSVMPGLASIASLSMAPSIAPMLHLGPRGRNCPHTSVLCTSGPAQMV